MNPRKICESSFLIREEWPFRDKRSLEKPPCFVYYFVPFSYLSFLLSFFLSFFLYVVLSQLCFLYRVLSLFLHLSLCIYFFGVSYSCCIMFFVCP